MMFNRLRKSPPVCLFISIIWLLTGKLRLSNKYFNNIVIFEDGKEFKIFREIAVYPASQTKSECVFIVNFKFAHLSLKANKLTSIIPMLMITGFPGFVMKFYAVDLKSGYWQGMYQWKSMKHLEEYKKSFVFRMMNKRAIPETIKSVEMNNQNLIGIIENKKVNMS